MDAPSITRDQIAFWNNPYTFARARNTESQSALPLVPGLVRTPDSIRTASIQGSMSLLSGSYDRLEQIKINLEEMLKTAKTIRGGSDSKDKQEIYGKLRSLAAGVDTYVKQTKFDGQSILDGKPWELNIGSAGNKIKFDMANLSIDGEDSLELAKYTRGAEASIEYDYLSMLNNAAYEVEGLNISGATVTELPEELLELKTGTYDLRVTYEGAASKVELMDYTGVVLDKAENVDLSGDGLEYVDFEATGIRLSFEKEEDEDLFYDKYDFATNGPAILTAKLNYNRIYKQELATGDSAELKEQSASYVSSGTAYDGASSLEFSDIAVNGIGSSVNPMKTGSYSVVVNYNGASSSAEIYDSMGILRGYKGNIDLTASGTHDIDLGVGVKISVDNNDFTGTRSSLKAVINYQEAEQASEVFDYKGYQESLESAIEKVEKEMSRIDDTYSQIDNIYLIMNGAVSGASAGAAALLGQSAGVEGGVGGLLNAAQTSGTYNKPINIFGDGSAEGLLSALA